MQLEKGMFLVASPDMEIPFFQKSVILLCEHSPAGSFGLCVNKTLSVELPEDILSADQNLDYGKVHMRIGGPMQPNQMMLLHSSNTIPNQTMEVCPGVFLGGDVDFLQHAIQEEEGPELMLCLGYSGWLSGALDKEFQEQKWLLSSASSKDLFVLSPEKLWQELLRKMGGKYSSLSMIPDDLSLN